MLTIAALAFLLSLTAGCTATSSANQTGTNHPAALQPIAALDVPRYLGTWYEIAKYPNRFQRRCVRDTHAEYRQLDDGRIDVINRCTTADGRMLEAVGLARQIGGEDSPILKVRFAPAWLSFLPMVWGDYWVIDLDPNYQLAAVSEPTRRYLWVLSRTPEVDAEAYQQLLNRLEEQGFDLGRLEWSQHGVAETS